MTLAQRRDWERRGRPFQLAYPLARVRDVLRAAGYTVYDIGNQDHLDADPPEDHTPYSATGWPEWSPYGWGHAIDIMPPPAAAKLPSLQVLGRRFVNDRNSGRAPFIKYINWGPTSDREAVQDRWQPNHERRPSRDTGHIHLSQRTDYTTSFLFDTYTPLGVPMDLTTPIPDPGWEAGANTDWEAVASGGPIALGQVLGGLHRRAYLTYKGMQAAHRKLDAIAEALAGIQSGAISQEAVDAALLAAAETLRFETRAVSPDAPEA